MREIKFKAINSKYYDLRKKEGVISWCYGHYACCVMPVVDNGRESHRVFYKNKEGKNIGSYLVIPETLCQYTGLKDKEGKEIYEGDVMVYDFEGEKNKPFVVLWHHNGWHIKYPHWDDTFSSLGYFALKHAAIIGNIHENPELL